MKKPQLTKKVELEIAIPLSIALAFVIILNFEFFNNIPNELFIPIIAGAENDFVRFALLVNFGYEMIPQTLQQLGVGAISTVLLSRGFNPWAYGLVIASGKFTGQFLIWIVFRLGFHRNKSFKTFASADHFLHKYHFLAFAFAPWISIGGDALMAVAGHQNINFFKIAPVLFATDLAEAYKWVFWTVGQIEVTNSFEF